MCFFNIKCCEDVLSLTYLLSLVIRMQMTSERYPSVLDTTPLTTLVTHFLSRNYLQNVVSCKFKMFLLIMLIFNLYSGKKINKTIPALFICFGDHF